MAFVCFTNNHLQYIQSRRLAGEPDEVRKYMQRLEHCQQPLDSWALAAGGSIVSKDPSHSIYEVPASALAEVGKHQERFAEGTNLDCWVGVGKDMHEAVMAADVAQRKGLKKPLLSQERYEDEPTPRQVVKSEPEQLEKSVKNWLKGAAAATLLAGGGMLASKYGYPQPKTATPVSGVEMEEPEDGSIRPPLKGEVVPPRLMATQKPQKRKEPRFINNPDHDKTFWAHYEPKTLHQGTNDTLWAIGMGETSGGLQWDHKPAKSNIYHPITGDRMLGVEDTAFGHFGMKPYTAMDAWVNGSGGTRAVRKEVGEELAHTPLLPYQSPFKLPYSAEQYEENFMNRFKRDPHFYNEIAKMHLKQIIDKHGKKGATGISNPFYILNAWHYGKFADKTPLMEGKKQVVDEKGKPVFYNKIAQDPDNYKKLILGHLSREVRAGKKLNFRDVFGNVGHGQIMKEVQNHAINDAVAKKTAAPVKAPAKKIPQVKKKG
jgi:hypothetical protein